MPPALRSLLPALVLALLAASPAGADTDPALPALFSLDFKGGAVTEYVKSIRRQNETANIVIMADAGDVRVPAVELRSVTVMTALSVLDGLAEKRPDRQIRLAVGEQEPESFASPRPPNVPGPARRVPVGTAVYTIHADVRQITRFGGPVPDVSQVMAVGELLEEIPPEALLTAIQTSMDLLGEDLPAARIRFHEDTGLIIARGHPEQMQAIEAVVEQVEYSVRTRMSLKRKAENREQQEAELMSLRAAMADSEAERQALRHEVLTHQTRMDLLQRELDESLGQLMAARAEKDELMSIVHRLEMEVARLHEDRDRKE